MKAGGVPVAIEALRGPAFAMGARLGVAAAGLVIFYTLPEVADAVLDQAQLAPWLRGAPPPPPPHATALPPP